jgi:hypothetical protein
MSEETVEELLRKADHLSADARLLLAARLIESVRLGVPAEKTRLKWRDIRGLAKPSMFGEDAQEYITRTRHEGTEHREEALKRDI